ncbi:MAG: hypothetical protein LUQ25_07855 [Methanoregulaceae archaeon]|nr:hypothetical protein [Methanoregulaceae archaeon]
MRTVIIALLVGVVVLPCIAAAQGGMMGSSGYYQGPGMVGTIEERAIGIQAHEEMEDLMEKMMRGTLNETEQERLITFMNERPGPYGMMVSRMMGGWAQGEGACCQQYGTTGTGYGMRGYGSGMMGDGSGAPVIWAAGLGFLAFAGIVLLVWLVVGVLLIIFLWKRISEK